VDGSLRGQHDRGRRQDDLVRDDPPVDVDRRQHDEHDAEERADRRIPAEAELPEATGDEQRRRKLDCGVAP